MRSPAPIKRYSLARPGVGEQRQSEAVRRLRLVRMEQIAARDHAREPSSSSVSPSRAP